MSTLAPTFIDIGGGVHPASMHDESPNHTFVKATGTSTTEDVEDEEEERIIEREYRHKEILFKIERYGITMFAIFFFVFNVVYWVDLLYNAKFHTARTAEWKNNNLRMFEHSQPAVSFP